MAKDKIDRDKIEEEYGLSYALFKAFPELNALLQKAVKGSWTPTKFQVELRQTNWFKKHSDTWRQNIALKYSDPASYKERLDKSWTAFMNIARGIGVTVSGPASKRLAERALLFGWDEGQVRDLLSKYVKPSKTGHYGGELSAIEKDLRNTALQNGVRFNDKQLKGWMQAMVRGDASQEQFQTYLRDLAAQTFKLYGDQIKGGMNLADVATPYIQAMAQTLELNPGSIDLFDPTIRSALQGRQNDKGETVVTGIADFETELRRSRRWNFTDQAKDQARGYTREISRMWGLG